MPFRKSRPFLMGLCPSLSAKKGIAQEKGSRLPVGRRPTAHRGGVAAGRRVFKELCKCLASSLPDIVHNNETCLKTESNVRASFSTISSTCAELMLNGGASRT